MPRSGKLAAAAVAVVAASLLGVPAQAATATTADNSLVVDLGANTGAFHDGASGALYGLYDDGVPSDNLIAGMGLTTSDTKAQDGQQHPGSDALEVAAPLVRSTNGDVYIYMTDVYRNFPYERTSYAEYQAYLKTEVQQVLTSPYRSHVVFVPYNEPDGNWFAGMAGTLSTATAFAQEWKQTYDLIKGLDPDARIAGPNLSWYYPVALGEFLSYCKANDCLPDVMTWHELGVPSTVRTDVAAYRALEKSEGVAPLPINLNEYAARYQLTNPDQMVGWLAALEETKVDGDLAYWNINGTLGDSTARQNVPNGQWWLYNWYSQLSGDTVQVTPSQDNLDYTMQGLATLDTAKRQARVILGGGAPGTTNVVVKNIDPKIFGTSVHATVLQDAWTGLTGAAGTPTRVSDQDINVDKNGTASVKVTDTLDERVTPACDSTGARVAGKIGNALKLCGDGSYAALPAGLVSGLNDYTISAWVNPSQNTTWSRLFDFGTGTDKYMFLTLNDGNELRFATTVNGPGAEQQLNATTTLPLNTWSHVAVTLSGTTGTLYVNGQAVATNPNMTIRPSDLGVTPNDWIGRSQYNDPYLDGTVDDFQIYDHALDATQVATLAGGTAGAGDVADYKFDEASGTTVTDSSGNGKDGTVFAPKAPATTAYQVILTPGGTGSNTAADDVFSRGYEAETATLTGDATVATEGSIGNTWGLTASNNQDVSGIRTGADTSIGFNVDVPRTGDYALQIYSASTTPTNAFLRVDGGPSSNIQLPVGYQATDYDHADTTVHLTAGKHVISLATTGDNGGVTTGDATIDKINLTLPAGASTVYEAEDAALSPGATTDYRRRQQSGGGMADLTTTSSATFWVSSDTDGYSKLDLAEEGGPNTVTVNGQAVTTKSDGKGGWRTESATVYLRSGINKVVVSGRLTLDKLTVTPVAAPVSTYQAEDGTLTGTATVDPTRGVVTGVSGGAANSLTFTVRAAAAGNYATTVRFANSQQVAANHYNPDLETAPADISVNGGPTFHVNFANTYSWDQFWNLTIPVSLKKGVNTIKVIANPQYNYDGKTLGVVYSGIGIGAQLRSDTAPDIDRITVAPAQLP